MASFRKILVIQTAFIGDVVLATSIAEQLHRHFPTAKIDFLLRKGNETLLAGHPFLDKVLIWDKKRNKYFNLIRLALEVRKEKYDLVVNPQRFFSTGLLMAFSGAEFRACFDKNPFSCLGTHRLRHSFGNAKQPIHEVERNLSLVSQWADNQFIMPRIYPSSTHFEKTAFPHKYITISPASVWYTKQFPKEKWLDFMDRVGEDTAIFLMGGPSDVGLCDWLAKHTRHANTFVKAGKFSFLESAALMKNAAMNFVNDSAPLHFASAVDAPVTAIFCSTVPTFGFWPLAQNSTILETKEKLDCRPCGLHGKATCPLGHFYCSKIDTGALLSKVP